MRRFLLVGCGGSGGATLAYLMDQLRSDLAGHGVSSIPRGWQFVHVDVPTVEESGPDGLGNVQQQGGRYFGIGPQGASYSVLDDSVSRRFAQARALDSIGTWAPRHPDQVLTPISEGAGQYRAIGRMITLSRVTDLREVLQSAWEELFRGETTSEMASLNAPGLGEYNNASPLVIVVSSMAGGAGASMALDLCRLLTFIPLINPKLTAVFMMSPNVFDALPEAGRTGVRANALAMLGEIVASQTGAAQRHDVSTLAALGQQSGAGAPLPFARVFPVGRFAGIDRTLFGNGSQGAVYRGLGRGLAGLIMSDQATKQYVQYDLGNTASPDGDRDALGWGSQWASLPWGSYGFASLNMGRDRYAEYSAQRLARSSIDRLLGGHLQSGSEATANDQIAALVDSQWDLLCEELELPTGRGGPNAADAEMGQWLTKRVFPKVEVQAAASKVIDSEIRPFLPSFHGMQAAQWVPALRSQLRTRRAGIAGAADRAATNWAFGWQRTLAERTVSTTADAVARLGIPFAAAFIDQLRQHCRDVLIVAAERLSHAGPDDVSAMPRDMEQLLTGLKGGVTSGQQLVERLLGDYRDQVGRHIWAHSADQVRQLLASYMTDVLHPLSRALNESHKTLAEAERAPVTDLGLARLATEMVAAWPSERDRRVHVRFDEADNEVLLTNSAEFLPRYETDLPRSVASGAEVLGMEDSRSRAVGQVISGIWETTGHELPPGGLLEQTSSWRPRLFSSDPLTGKPLVPSHARFDLHVRPAELLRRTRSFVGRPGQSFQDFCKVSLREYVEGDGAGESELAERQRDVRIKFVQALSLARPLISVNGQALAALHRNQQVGYRYKFSEVPFLGIELEEELRAVLTADPMIDGASVSNLDSAFDQDRQITKVDIFGSYPHYSPLVFDAVLGPVAEQWSQTFAGGRKSFWQWRRSRPLDAALPMGDVERRTMVAGWFLGQIVGRIRIPGPPFAEPVQVWDPEIERWASFPFPLLTPPGQFIADYDWLPAVLESYLLAIARCHDAPVMASLRPYQLLRGVYDSSSQDPASGIVRLSGMEVLTDWIREGVTASGRPSRIAEIDRATSIDQRAKIATEWLQTIRDLAGVHFMAPDDNGALGGGAFSIVTTRKQATGTPIFRDLAPDVYRMTGELIKLVEEARVAAASAEPELDTLGLDLGAPGAAVLKEGTF